MIFLADSELTLHKLTTTDSAPEDNKARGKPISSSPGLMSEIPVSQALNVTNLELIINGFCVVGLISMF